MPMTTYLISNTFCCRLAARKAKDTTLVPAGFVRLVNITDGAKRQGTAVSKAVSTHIHDFTLRLNEF